MNREPISYYLKNPSKLVDLSVNQIEKWLQESPFSQPIRSLLAKKLHYNQEIVLDPVIVGAATTASNRTWLYRELHGKVEFKADSAIDAAEEDIDVLNDLTPTTTAESVMHEIIAPETVETPIAEMEAKAVEVIAKEKPEGNDAINHIVEYEEVASLNTLDQTIQNSENEDIALTTELEEEIIENQDEIGSEHVDLEEQLEETKEEIAVELLPSIKQEKVKPIKATLDIVANTPKLIDLNQAKSKDNSKSIPEIQVIRVETDDEFVAGRDHDKKKAKGKKKDNKKVKKDKTKKKKSDKKSDEKDNKKDKKKKSAKKAKKKAKREKKERKRLKALDDFWEGREEITPAKQKEEKASKKKSKVKNKKSKGKNKKSKVELLKYDIPVSPSEEEANHYTHDLSEMSNYTQWLLQFSKDKADGSFDHMTTATSKSSTGIEDISFSSSEDNKKAKKKKKGKKKQSSNVKNKSKTDHSLEANEEIISELWADLLAKQGHIKKARKMYLKLSLKYPEKSSYFASKLENL